MKKRKNKELNERNNASFVNTRSSNPSSLTSSDLNLSEVSSQLSEIEAVTVVTDGEDMLSQHELREQPFITSIVADTSTSLAQSLAQMESDLLTNHESGSTSSSYPRLISIDILNQYYY